MQGNAEKLADILRATGLAEPLELSQKDGAVEVLFRVRQDQAQRWTRLMRAIKRREKLEKEHPHKWRSRIFKEFFLNDSEEEDLVYGWVFYVQSNMMPDSLDMIAGALRGSQPAAPKRVVELDEMPMTGLSPDHERNVPRPGSERGAYKYGKWAPSFR